jgi:hypothetical protein
MRRGVAVEFLGVLMPFVGAGAWLWWLTRADRLEPEPWPLVAKTFGVGALAGLAGLIGLVIIILILPEDLGAGAARLLMVPVGVAAIAGVTYQIPYRSPEWNDPFDGLVYGGAAGIGYGLTYTLISLFEGALTGFRTAVFSIPIYMLAGLIIGHYLSEVRFASPHRRASAWARGLGFAALALAGVELASSLGGAVMNTDHPVASAFVYGANTVGWIVAMGAMDAKNRASQFNPLNYRLPLAETGCPACGSSHVAHANYCNTCGASLAAWKGAGQV